MEKSVKYHGPEQSATLCAFDLGASGEFGTEVTLADYYPEICKVVSVSAKAFPDSKYISDGALEIGGTLAFYIVYIGDDGTLSCQSFITEYSQSFPIGEFNGGSRDIFTCSEAEMPQCRVLAPRTVSLKAKIKSRVFADKREDCSFHAEGEGGAPVSPKQRRSLESLERDIETVHRSYCFVTDGVSGRDSLSHPSKPVVCRGEAVIKEITAKEGGADIKGVVHISCTVLTDEGLYKRVLFQIPFDKSVRCEGATNESQVCAFARAATVSAKTDEDGGGIGYEAEYDMDVYFATPRTITVTEDIYSTSYRIETLCRPMEITDGSFAKNASVPVSFDAPRKTETGDGESIIDAVASPKIESARLKDGKVYLIASCNYKIYIASEGDVKTEDVTVPIEYECPAGDLFKRDGVWHFAVTDTLGEIRLEGQRVFIKGELCLCAFAYTKLKCSPVVSCELGEEETDKRADNEIRVCYPEKGKRIWDIAKECRCSLMETERINRVDRCGVSDGSPIIVR